MWVSRNDHTPTSLAFPSAHLRMRRATRKALLNLTLFAYALLLILYLNQSSGARRTTGIFAWTTIRYRSASTSTPPALGVCRNLQSSAKPALVVARMSKDDASWLDSLSKKYHVCIYTADAVTSKGSKQPQVPANRGHEAMTYLTFIIDNYASIPAAGVVFVHGDRFSWHNDHPEYDNADLLTTLNVSEAIATQGYHNMRCDWSGGTCGGHVIPQGSMENMVQAEASPWELGPVADALLPGAFAQILGADPKDVHEEVLLGRDDILRTQCCAQFAVSRESILQHTREEYVALRQWLLDDVAPNDDRVSGRILSFLWHVLFIRHELSMTHHAGIELAMLNKLACPYAGDCYCRLYGKCDLQCASAGQCRGQYKLPSDYRLPENSLKTQA